MKRIERFFGKPKEIELAGEKITIHPLTIKQVDLILDLADETKRNESMKKLLQITLKKTFPEATPEEIEQIGMIHFNDLTMAIMDVNGLETPKGMEKPTTNPKA